ncbi:MAG: ribonuclease R [Proteobacteria bacterium]|nr:ribonuclease R [Pseudomonadota bacterium]
MARRPRKHPSIPTKDDILRLIRESPGPMGKREIARAFGIKGSARAPFRNLVKELERDGLIGPDAKRGGGGSGVLPRVGVIEIAGTDSDGEVIARPVKWPEDTAPPIIYLAPDRPGLPAPGQGERLLARLKPIGEGAYEAVTIHRLGTAPRDVLGVYEVVGGRGRITPVDKRAKSELTVEAKDSAGARSGELVRAQTLTGRRFGPRKAKVIERLGHMDDAGAISLISLHAQGVPMEFSAAALDQAEGAQPPPLGDRADLRELALVTIDDEHARDFDDAVWAEPDPDPANGGGWHFVVAIADVTQYVRPGDALDQCAYERGNSVYLPDRVVPMLPERLSNDLCSLRPDEDRPCLAVHIWIDRDGKRLKHRFERAMMRSAARLTYGQVQDARDGAANAMPAALLAATIAPLYGVYDALNRARERRGALDLDLPEYRVVLGDDGGVDAIEQRRRFDSHRLIEECMIAANVAAAVTLTNAKAPCMYRVHDQPDPAKVEALRGFLKGLGIGAPSAGSRRMEARQFTEIIAKAAGTAHEFLLGTAILRAQARAVYSPGNIGHFGLALERYAHFTSPIRRYADLIVHRALISVLGLGEGGFAKDGGGDLAAIGEHISATERRAVECERDAMDRYTALYLAERIGAKFPGRIGGVTRFGLFITLDETGADGLVPIRTLGREYFDHDERRHCLEGRDTGTVYTLGDRVEVRLAEANPVTGGMIFELLDHDGAANGPGAPDAGRKRPPGRGARPRRGRKRSRR